MTNTNTTKRETIQDYAREYARGIYNEIDNDFNEFLDGILDLDYVVNGRDKHYAGVKIYIALGGPTAYIDTRNGFLYVGHGNESATVDIFSEYLDMIDDVFRGMYENE